MPTRITITTRAADLSIADTAETVPATISYKGALTDASGSPVTTATTAVFSIYDQPVSGSARWTETHDVTPDANGRFTIELGRVTPIQIASVEKSPSYLAVHLSDAVDLPPRTVIANAPTIRGPEVLTVEATGTVNRVLDIQPSKSGSVMGVRDPGGDIRGTLLDQPNIIQGVRDPGGDIGGSLTDRSSSIQGVRDPGGDISGALPDGSITIQGVRDPGGDMLKIPAKEANSIQGVRDPGGDINAEELS